jgi:D-beta-D-heptose 7-phosphate kinase/D-beta-D-heptose 1-phosphate adenosyltransferase
VKVETSLTGAHFQNILDRFSAQQIAVIGDLILDEFIWGRVDRISPEAPVPVVEVTRESERLGGAANVSRNLVSLGARVRLVGTVGSDEAGKRFLEHLNKDGVDGSGIVVDPSRRTTTKSRIIAHHQQVCRFDREGSTVLDSEVSRRLEDRALRCLDGVDAVIISDYAKGVVTPSLVRSLVDRSLQASIFVAVDPKRLDFSAYEGVSIITPNLKEASRAAGIVISNEEQLAVAAQRIREICRSDHVLVTRGEEGMSLLSDGSIQHFAAVAREVFDVTGAGDTVIAALALAFASGASPADAVVIANHAAGVVVGKLGTATVSVEELLGALLSDS